MLIEDTVVAIANGGTGQSSLAGAQSALGITALSDQIATYLHVEELTYDSTNGYFPVTGIPRDGMQICVPARNISTGAIYILWYSHTQRAFRVGATVSGNAPANGEKVAVQFIQ